MRFLASLAGLLGLSGCSAALAPDAVALAVEIFTRGGTYRAPFCLPADATIGVVLPGGEVVEVPMALVAARIGAEVCP